MKHSEVTRLKTLTIKEMVGFVDEFIKEILKTLHNEDAVTFEELTSEMILVKLQDNEVEIPVNADTVEYLLLFLQNCLEDSLYNK